MKITQQFSRKLRRNRNYSTFLNRKKKHESISPRCCCCCRRRRTCEKATTDFAFVKINDNMKREGGGHTQNRMDFSIVGERRAIQSTGTKSAKVKGWRRKMLLLMRSSASRVLTSTPIELLSDTTTSVVAQLVKWEKSFLREGRENHYLGWKYGSRYAEKYTLKSWREK